MSDACAGCARSLEARAAFRFQEHGRAALRCGRCALLHRPLLRRSLGIAAVVGTVLVAINQGDAVLAGRWPAALAWKIPLTYLVPFVVATWGALVNTRVSSRSTPHRGD
ncbi:MAG: nitrate/nitrite transporter NrtS [Candidatus Rokubacteria bacterium]|nr:nitrate/nitrite transporter NrtS [Candidatus Rokubacteria bacterium]